MRRVWVAFILLLCLTLPAFSASVLVYWSPSTDNPGGSGLAGYKIYRGGVLIGTSAVTYYTDTTAASNTAYNYTVSAFDNAGNESAQAVAVSVTSGPGTVRNVTCSGDITAALQTAINASATSDTVSIGAGSCSISSTIIMSETNIVVKGAGQGVTNISTIGIGAGKVFNVTSNNGATFSWRISGFSLSNTSTQTVSGAVYVNCDTPSIVPTNGNPSGYRGAFRVDHIDFNYPSSGDLTDVLGPCYGLYDHNTFTSSGGEHSIAFGMDMNAGPPSGGGGNGEYANCFNGGPVTAVKGAYGASLPFTPGGSRAIFMEDNVFQGPSTTVQTFAKDTDFYTGGRLVFRHNTVNNAGLYSHWTNDCVVNAEWNEIYSNNFDAHGGGINPSPLTYCCRMQGGGTGLIYNNTFVNFSPNVFTVGEGRLAGQSGPPLNFCDGTNNWDGNLGDASAAGWPCLAQLGRAAGVSIANIIAGTKQASFPMYLWNNGPQAKCSNPGAAGAACDNSFGISISGGTSAYFSSTPHTVTGGGQGQGDVDYSITASQPTGAGTHTLTYTPYVYPHPLTTIP